MRHDGSSNFCQDAGRGQLVTLGRAKAELDVNTAATKSYHARLRRVLDHIETHLEDRLSIETLSGVAA